MSASKKLQKTDEAEIGFGGRFAFFIATGAGAGLIPGAPGTYGSIEGVALYVCLAALDRRLGLSGLQVVSMLIAANVIVYAVGTLAAGSVCRMLDSKDPGQVVVDEISGQLIALSPMLASPTLRGMIVGFLLFRLLDIFKPLLIRRVEGLPGGFGVMTDDVLAGIYAAILIGLGRAVHLI
ncbi:MAG: phosphatidylglycerophosphatase A [Blastocatellia bacterium AA13]|nr:MAG: phosphatidylglycerophosphatase A [Blastocatellia bacterium AA13]